MTLQTRKMRITTITPQMVEEIRSFHLCPSPPGTALGFNFIPGQFVQISTSPGESSYFAIASPPEDLTGLDFLVKRGKGASREMFDLSVGSEVDVTGPQGKGFPIAAHKGKNLLMIGVGTGIAPLRSALQSALSQRENFGDLIFVYGVLTPQHFCYMDDLHYWSRNSVQVHLTVTFPEGTSWVGHSGLVQDVLKTIKLRPANTVALLVGMKEMIQENTQLLLEMGFAPEDLLLNY
jgi:NAD(P)H-flavin reductase